MKPFFTFLTIVSFCFLPSQAQDLILTAEGDSINCLITRIKNGFIYFSFRSEGEIRHTLIPASRVKYYQPSYFQQAEFSSDQIMAYPYDYQRFKLTVYFGNSILTREFMNNTPPELLRYYLDLRSCQLIGGNVTLFPREWFGWGFDYARFQTSNQLEGYTWEDPATGAIRSGLLRDEITIQFFGPMACIRYYSKNRRFQSFEMVSIGNLAYSNNYTLGENYKINSSVLGARNNAGVDGRKPNCRTPSII